MSELPRIGAVANDPSQRIGAVANGPHIGAVAESPSGATLALPADVIKAFEDAASADPNCFIERLDRALAERKRARDHYAVYVTQPAREYLKANPKVDAVLDRCCRKISKHFSEWVPYFKVWFAPDPKTCEPTILVDVWGMDSDEQPNLRRLVRPILQRHGMHGWVSFKTYDPDDWDDAEGE